MQILARVDRNLVQNDHLEKAGDAPSLRSNDEMHRYTCQAAARDVSRAHGESKNRAIALLQVLDHDAEPSERVMA